MKFLSRRCWIFSSTLASLLVALPAAAQIEADTTLPENSIVTPNGDVIEITGGTRAGDNLFHSFEQFSVLVNQNASFLNDLDIINIFSRVTGGSVSEINGVISAQGAANLFLINPAGIIFGEGAALNVGGSFFASSAESILFTDGTQFSANPAQNSAILTVTAPIGLGLGTTPGDITVQNANLQVPQGQTLALIGGNVNLQGNNQFFNLSNLDTDANLFAPGGRIELGGLSTAGVIDFLADGTLSFPEGVARGDVTLTDAAAVNVRADNGGSIAVNARVLEMSGQSVIVAGIEEGKGEIDVDAGIFTQAGDITIDATDRVTLIGDGISIEAIENQQATDTTISNSIGLRPLSDEQPSTAQGNAGNIFVNTNILELFNRASIVSSAFGFGGSGAIVIEANRVTLDGERTNLTSEVFVSEAPIANSSGETKLNFSGVGGINVTAQTVTLTNKSNFFTWNNGFGTSGNIIVNAESVSLDEGSVAFSLVTGVALGDEGRVEINADAVTLSNGAKLQAETFGVGNVGGVFINDAQTVSFTGGSDNENLTAIFSSATIGNSGGIFITADTISLDNNILLFSWVREGGTGIAGNIEVNTNSLSLNNFSRLQSQVLAGAEGESAGNIIINAADNVSLTEDSFFNTIFTAEIDSVGKAGDIELNTGSLLIDDSSLLTNTEGNANAGKITIRASDRVTFNDGFAQAELGIPSTRGEFTAIPMGDGGSIDIAAKEIFLSNFSLISVKTRPETQGETGNIILNAEIILIDSDSTVSGITQNVSDGGDILVTANTLDIENNSRIATSTSSSGKAGNIILEVSDRITISDNNIPNIPPDDLVIEEGDILRNLETGIFANTGEEATGDGGSIAISTREFLITDGAEITVSSTQGQAGNLEISADNLFLNQGKIAAETALTRGDSAGANINLAIADLLLLQNESLISATARENADGGNVNITTDFLIAFPPTGEEGSDIRANAERGAGGNVNIAADTIFGIEFRDNPTPDNDITVSSQFGSSGTVTITTPEVDPTSGVLELPDGIVDLESLIAKDVCAVEEGRIAGGSSFVITGRGGLPPTSEEPIANLTRIVDWADSVISHQSSVTNEGDRETGRRGDREKASVIVRQRDGNQRPEVEQIQGWIVAEDGTIILTANAPKVTPHNAGINHPECNSHQSPVTSHQ